MAEYKTPGVYVEEISKFPPSVAGVATAIPAFIGVTEKYPTNQPVRITSLLDFEKKFGYGPKLVVSANEAEDDEELTTDVTPEGENSGEEEKETEEENLIEEENSTEVEYSQEEYEEELDEGNDSEAEPIGDSGEEVIPLRLMRNEGETEFPTYSEDYTLKGKNFVLYDSIRLFYDNGGGVCYVASIGTYEQFENSNPTWDNHYIPALNSLRNIDEVTLLLAPDAAMLLGDKLQDLQKQMLIQCGELGDRFAILDLIEEDSLQTTLSNFRNGVTDHLSYGAAYYPNLISSYSKEIDFESIIIALGGVPKILEGIKVEKKKTELKALFEAIDTAIEEDEKKLRIKAIIPQIPGYAEKLAELQAEACVIPPSGAIAGIYAANDSSKGVWQAPANVGIASISGLTRRLSDADQADMNVDANTGKSVNAIRYFAGKGILVWGARTLDGNSNEWRYVPVRRLFNYIEESVQKSTAWAVFQPNDANTWVKIQCQIENFLNNLWRDGALAGSSPEKAFYVKVGQDITMTAADILAGYLIVEIGIAAVRPAEFIVLKFSHKLQEA